MACRRPVMIKELAERFECSRFTINRCLQDLETEGQVPINHLADRSVELDVSAYLNDVRLNLNEAMAMFMAVRLLARYSDKPNPHAVTALNKLSIALNKVSKQIASHIARTSERLNRPMSEVAQDYARNLQTLTEAWANGTRVRLVKREEPNVERLFEPYFIEPSAVGYVSYVIGYDHHRQSVRTFRIERLLRVSPTVDPYTIPPTFDPLAKLAGAWGVNWGDGDVATEVLLKFAVGRVTERVRETSWHETQLIDDLPDGGCVLRITVGSTQEMKPWIRQWGPDCEVLAPPALRAEIGEEMRRAGEIYD